MNEENTQATSAVDVDDWSDIDPVGEDISGEEESTPTADEAASETDEADQPEQTDGEADKEETESTDTKETDQFTLKHLDEVKTVSRDEVISYAQKGMDYDRIRAKLDEITTAHTTLTADKTKTDERITAIDELSKSIGYKDIDDFVDNINANKLVEQNGIDKNVALQTVKLNRKEQELAAKEAKIAEQKTAQISAEDTAKKAAEKRDNDFADFVEKYKDIKPTDIPKEVWLNYNKGGSSLIQAYIEHENAQLKAKLEADKKSAENKARTTGSRTTEGKSTSKDKEDTMWYSD